MSDKPDNRAPSLAVLAVALATACGAPDSGSADRGDAPGRDVAVRSEPRRIVSLIPAVTEILFDLGAGDRLVGRTRWGIHPPPARRIPDVGDGIRPSLEAVLAREPDLVVLYDGETNRESRDRLRRLGVATLALRHDTLEDLRRNILRLGELVGCPDGGTALADRIVRGLAAVSRATEGRPRVRVYYDAWAEPPMTIGRGSFINSLLTIAGGVNVFGDLAPAAPRVSIEAIIDRDPERILVSVARAALHRPPDLGTRHGWERIPAVAAGRISTLDRDVVSRLGPRVPEAARSIAEALHGELPAAAPEPAVAPCSS
ncbi:ABC transporter substrate-binding protein [Candidatus Palauibacter sp.]|uniref:ABC transporter substrate-binding protein n=1 Tax=Candidatus Palauibacter sp. TaxID=3101350 RepID=UPI003B01A3CD